MTVGDLASLGHSECAPQLLELLMYLEKRSSFCNRYVALESFKSFEN